MNRLFRAPPVPSYATLDIDGASVRVTVRQVPRARHYRLTVDARKGPILTFPKGGRWTEAEAFLDRQRGWLQARLDRQAVPVVFEGGVQLPLRGEPHTIVSTGRSRGNVQRRLSGGSAALLVPGGEAHLARRLTDWLKAECRTDLELRVGLHAERLGVRHEAIRIRDQSSRWGSCSSAGRLNFNWRLILAPEFVLDYVAAHEVAHLIEMNHSPAFWETVRRTLPDMQHGRDWLRAHGRGLRAYG